MDTPKLCIHSYREAMRWDHQFVVSLNQLSWSSIEMGIDLAAGEDFTSVWSTHGALSYVEASMLLSGGIRTPSPNSMYCTCRTLNKYADEPITDEEELQQWAREQIGAPNADTIVFWYEGVPQVDRSEFSEED